RVYGDRPASPQDLRTAVDVCKLLAVVVDDDDLRSERHATGLSAPGFARDIAHQTRIDRDRIAGARSSGDCGGTDVRLDFAANGDNTDGGTDTHCTGRTASGQHVEMNTLLRNYADIVPSGDDGPIVHVRRNTSLGAAAVRAERLVGFAVDVVGTQASKRF